MYSCNIPRKHNITLDTTGRQRMLPRENLVETEFSEKVADNEFEGEKKGSGGEGESGIQMFWLSPIPLSFS